MANNSEAPPEAPPKRAHRATYANDKRNGGYIVRVEGPHATKFSKRTVPVTRRDNTESLEELTTLIWGGTDETTKLPIALYAFKRKAPTTEQVEF